MTDLHPYCQRCGWRKGGRDSWDGRRCKCGESEPPIQPVKMVAILLGTALAVTACAGGHFTGPPDPAPTYQPPRPYTVPGYYPGASWLPPQPLYGRR